MVFMFLVVIPISNGYDFLGEPNHKNQVIKSRISDKQIKETVNQPKENLVSEDTKNVPPVVEEPIVEEVVEEPADEPVVEEAPVVEEVAEKGPVKETAPETTLQTPKEPEILPEPEDIPVREEKLDYCEVTYESLLNGNAMDKLPASESGNYVIIYSSNNCIYCEKLITELKGNTGDYILVVIKCTGVVRDLFYTRLTYNYYPAFLVIKNKQVKYYGYGYRTLEEFKRFL